MRGHSSSQVKFQNFSNVLSTVCISLLVVFSARVFSALPAVPVPAENPYDFANPTAEQEAKRVLGKILFWDEQLSTDNTVACGTCHLPSVAGGDPRQGTHPGPDGIFSTADDVIGSPGVVRRNSDGVAIEDAIFGFEVQVTDRLAPNFFGGIFGDTQFWDGRAEGQLIDPLDGVTVAIASGGALENQALGPILSDVEMAKEGRTWQEVTDKLASVTPLAFASDIPADMASAIAVNTTYGDLFAAAFGDSAITPVRIAFAIATYERTLLPDQSPFDLGAMTIAQQNGLAAFNASNCVQCHGGDNFSQPINGDDFRNVGVSFIPANDSGRAAISGNNAERGEFKIPTLRNIGVKTHFMHNGSITSIDDVITFYAPVGPPPGFGNQNSIDNIDPLMPVGLPPGVDQFFLALTDPRVANGTFPFDAPVLSAAGQLSFSVENVPLPIWAFFVMGLILLVVAQQIAMRNKIKD